MVPHHCMACRLQVCTALQQHSWQQSLKSVSICNAERATAPRSSRTHLTGDSIGDGRVARYHFSPSFFFFKFYYRYIDIDLYRHTLSIVRSYCTIIVLENSSTSIIIFIEREVPAIDSQYLSISIPIAGYIVIE